MTSNGKCLSVLCLLFIFLLTFSSCDDDELISGYVPARITIITYSNNSKSSILGKTFIQYSYDEKNRVIQKKTKHEAFWASETIFTFDTLRINYDNLDNPRSYSFSQKQIREDRPITWNYYNTIVTYNTGKIACHTEGYSSREFDTDSEDRILQQKGESPIIYEYDTYGNITSRKEAEYNSYIYRYDEKNGIFKNVKTKQWLWIQLGGANAYQSINNIVAATETAYFRSTEEHIYQYNNAAYPTSYKTYYYLSGKRYLRSETKIEYIIR